MEVAKVNPCCGDVKMMRWLKAGAWAVCLAGGVSSAWAAEAAETKMLAFPAVSQDKIAFVYDDDLWTADLDGKNPRRLTSDLGLESNPAFSADGKTIAFSAQYDGNTDVYTIPATGGSPTRLTWHPGADTVRGFTPDGKAVLFSSARSVFTNRYSQLFTVALTGGMPTQLPIPNGVEACFSPDGKRIAYCPIADRSAQWKNYRGGTHSRVLIFDTTDKSAVQIPQPKDRCNDTDPQWIGDNVYFRSDRNGEFNLFAYNVGSKEVRQLTKHADFPVIDISANGEKIIYEQAGCLHLFDVTSSQSHKLTVAIASDLVETRGRFARGGKYVRNADVSPSGARAVFEFRGEIVTVPAEKGDPRNLTNTTGIHERDPAWSPDGKTIAYFSDASGEYELVLAPQNGKGAVKKIKLTGGGFYSNPVWSRDSKKLLYVDNSECLHWVDIASGKITKIVDPEYGLARGVKFSSWSPDAKWVAYSIDNGAHIAEIYAYSLEQNKSFKITDGLSEAVEPVFDTSGKYLYFLGSNDTGMSKHGFALSSADSRRPQWSIYLAVLRKDLPSPFLRESDEEKGETPAADRGPGRGPGEDRSDEPKIEETRKNGQAQGKGRGQGGGPGGSGGQRRGGAAEKPPEVTKIDFDGIGQRILALPLPAGNYADLQAGSAGQLYYLVRGDAPEGGGGRRGDGIGFGRAALHRYDIDKKKDDTVQATVGSYTLTPDARKMLYSTGPGTWMIASTSGGGGSAPAAAPAGGGAGGGRRRGPGGGGGAPQPAGDAEGGSGRLNVDAIEVRVEPREEWKQIFNEAWRVNRDYFYATNMHGADWPAMRKKYEGFLPHCASSADVYRVIKWMLSELAVGHSYTTPGERLHERRPISGGLLGADYEIANGRYRFKKIYGGLNWTPDLRSPLTAPGVNVKAGDYLLAVRGVDLKPPTEIYSLFESSAGKSVEITVGPNADGKGSRTVTVEPLENESALRNREWVEGNLRKVQEATGGKVGYVYVPDTAGMGMTYFKRYFFPQCDKEALIIDERFNGGGQIADYYIDILRRPLASFWAPRHGHDWRSPSAAVFGPKVMIIDETAGSGGDMLPWMFRKFGLGTIVGKRTWGGLVGIGGYPTLMDGGRVTAPGFAIWTEDGWVVENEGVPPDVEIEQTPAEVIAGRDPQLEKAIEIALAKLKEQPAKKPQRPPFPVRARTNGKLASVPSSNNAGN